MATSKEKIPAVSAKKGQKQNLVIQNITIKSPTRQSVDISAWRQALQSAESSTGRRIRLYDLYEDLMLDNVLSDAIDKRIMAITNSRIIFQKNDQPVPEITTLIDSGEFELLLTEIMNAKFWGISLVEFDFTNGFSCAAIPRKHINPRTGEVLLNQSDETGIPYRDNPFFLETGDKTSLGLILKAAPYVIYKRGGFGDWAQFAEIFGMPFRKGTYNGYDDYTRKLLEEALDKSGGNSWIVIPKDGNIEYIENKSSGSGGQVYNLLKDACNQEILIGILGQTMTTVSGSSRAQSQTHKEVESAINKSDIKYVTRILNSRFIPLLEARGYPVAGGQFQFPEEAEDLSLKDRVEIDVKLNDVIDIPPEYFYKKYGIPKPDGKVLKKPGKKDEGSESKRDNLVSEQGALKKLFSFFLKTPTAGLTKVCPMCGGDDQDWVSLSIDNDRALELLLSAAKRLLEGEIDKNQTDADLALMTGDVLMKAFRENYPGLTNLSGEDVDQLRWINRQQSNIYHFGVAKSYAMMKSLRDKILLPDGKVTSFEDFYDHVTTIDQLYNRTWLEAEYHAVVRGTVMGVKWMEIEQDKEIAPYLMYVTAGDDRVRDSHKELAKTIEPVGSGFWDQYYPPNGWRCRCSVKQISEREAESAGYTKEKTKANSEKAGQLVKDKYWRKNVGKTTIIEADGTAYMESVPGKGKKQLNAVDHYGMKPYSRMRENANLPEIQRKTKDTFESWWAKNSVDGEIIRKDPNGIPLRFDEKFKKHLLKNGENHWGIIDELFHTINKPDEIWENIKSGRKEKWFRTYIRYGKPNPVVLMVDENNSPVTFYELDSESPESFRFGILIKRK